jgi:hypothetical protein
MNESENFYTTSSYDSIVKNVTIAMWILLIAESIFFIYLFSTVISLSSLSIILAVFIPSVSLIVLLVPYLFKPKGFRLKIKELTIERTINAITIPYEQISRIQRGNWTWKAIRLGGSGGLYGYLGLFHFFGIGRVWMYVTNRHKMVLIETDNGKKYAISPEDPDDFIFQLKRKLA